MIANFASSAKILLVDDSESNRYVLAAWLRQSGLSVTEARTGTQALDALRSDSFDLVVLDVGLPDMSGYEVCEQIKAGDTTALIPVLHVSASAVEVSDRSEGLRRGAEGYLVEPVEKEELLATIEALLRAATAQRTAMRLTKRLQELSRATLALHQSSTIDELVARIAAGAGRLFDSRAIVTVALGDNGYKASALPNSEVVVSSVSARSLEEAYASAGLGESPISGAVLGELVPSAEASYRWASIGTQSDLFGLLLIEERPESDRSTFDEVEAFVTQYAVAAATALRNHRAFATEHAIALQLQRSLLPGTIPPIDGMEIAVRYEASTANTEVGGDFYEVFTAGSRIIIAIGDIGGHSLEAATVMAQLRMALRTYMLEGFTPTDALVHLNQILMKFHPEAIATVCCGIYERETQRCILANGGHLPPLLLARDRASYLPLTGRVLGIGGMPPPQPYEFQFTPGDTLVLFTDGLIERREENIDVGLDRLARAATGRMESVEALCDRLLREAGPRQIIDDIALVAVRAC